MGYMCHIQPTTVIFSSACVTACSTDLDHLVQTFGIRVCNVLFVVQIYDTL